MSKAEQPATGALADIIKGTQRLNPCVDLDVDVLAVSRAAAASTTLDWQAGTLTNLTADAKDGALRISELGTAVTLFSQTAAHSVQHFLRDGVDGAEEYALDFFPDPSVTQGVPFTLDSLDLWLGRTQGAKGGITAQVSYYDTSWRLVPMGDPITILMGDVLSPSGLYTLNFTQLSRRFVFQGGSQSTATGTGRDGSGNSRTAALDARGVSHIVGWRGISISIRPFGADFSTVWIGCVPTGTAPAFDTTAFWRSASNRNCGPYNPVDQPYPGSDTSHNPDNYLITGAVPGYGAIAVTNGQWGVARRIPTAQRAQNSANGWQQPYHVLRVKAYNASGTAVNVLDMGATPANDVEIRLDDIQPQGTSITYSLERSNDGTTWASIGTVVDGQVFTGGDLARYYRLTSTFTAGPSGATKYASPILQSWMMVERVTLSTYRYLKDFDSTVTVDPVTAQSSIGELKLPVLTGGRVDFRDLASQLGSNYAPSQIEAHVYAKNTRSGKRYFLNSYRLEDRSPSYGTEEMTFVSGMDRLTSTIPPAYETYRYPASGQVAITSVSNVGTTYTISVSGAPFVIHTLQGFRVHGVTGTSAGYDYTVLDSPQNTTSAFSVTISDTTVTPAPVAGDTIEIHSDETTRSGATYVGADFASIYSDLLSVQSAVPSRYRGALPKTTGRTATYSIPADGVKALDILQDVALHAGGFPAWIKGRISFVDFYGKKESVATWGDRHIVSLDTPVGADRRMPSVRVKYGYQADTGSFTNQSTYTDADTLLGWGLSNLFDVFELPDEYCKWNDVNEANWTADTFQKAWKSGVRIWKVKTVLLYPHIEQGDAVTILTSQYTDRRLRFSADGVTDQGSPVTGPTASIGVIVGKNLWGDEFLVAIRGLDDVTSAVSTIETIESPPGISNFREIARTDTEVTFGWTVTGAVSQQWLYVSTPAQPVSTDPWAALTGAPNVRLTADTASCTISIPAPGLVTYGQLVPMNADAEVGKIWQFTVQGASVNLIQRASIVSTSATQVVVRVAVANPVTGGDVTISYVGGSVSPSSPQTILAAGVTTDIATTGYVDFTITRPAFQAGSDRVTFTASSAGRVSDTDSVDIPAKERDTVYLATRARVTASTATTATVRVAVADPIVATDPQAVTVTYTETGGTGTACTPASGGTLTPAATLTEAVGTYIDYTVTRPDFGTGTRRVTFTASATNRTSSSDAVDVPAVEKLTFGPSLTITPTPGPSSYSIAWSGDSVTVSIDGGAYSAPSTSPITVTRNPANGADKIYAFSAVKDGQTVTDSVVIPAIGAVDTVGPSLTVTPTPGPSSYSVAWSGTGTVTVAIDGGSYGTPATSPITVTRNAANGADKVYSFRAVNGSQTVTDSVVIPAIGAVDTNTVTPDLTVTPSAPTTNTQTFTATASNPSGGTAPTITYDLIGCTAGGGTITSAGNPHTYSSAVVVDRPAWDTAAQATISFKATIAGNGSETIARTVQNQVRDTQALAARVLRVSETATQVTVRLEVTSPNAGATVTVTYDAGGLTVTPASGGTLTSTTSFGTTGHIDYTITRPVYTGAPSRVTFVAAASGYTVATDGYDVVPLSRDLAVNKVVAAEISVTDLSAINANLGTVTSGYIQNSGNTAAIRLSGSTTLPTTNFIDFTATGSSPFLKTGVVQINSDGSSSWGTGVVPQGAVAPRNRCRVYDTANQSIGNNSGFAGQGTPLTFTSESFDVGGLHDISSNTSRITIPTGGDSGVWLLVAQVTWDANTSGSRALSIRDSGSFRWAHVLTAASADFIAQQVTCFVNAPSVGQYFEAFAWQDSGGSLNVIGGNTYTYFSAIHLW